MEKKKTGYRICNRPIYVGDVLALHEGFCGFFRVEQRGNEYWLVDDDRYRPVEFMEQPMRLIRDLGIQWSKTDPNNPRRILSVPELMKEAEEANPIRDEAEAYFREKCRKTGIKFLDQPCFNSKEEVDRWFKMVEECTRDL